MLAGISEDERVWYAGIERVVREGVEEIRRGVKSQNISQDGDAGAEGGGKEWCLPRHTRRAIPGTAEINLSTTAHAASQNGEEGSQGGEEPPVILSPTSETVFRSFRDISGRIVVKNPSSETAILQVRAEGDSTSRRYRSFYIPPFSAFNLCILPTSETGPISSMQENPSPIPGLSTQQKFDLILLDPPWPNRSVKRSRNYQTNEYFDVEGLTSLIRRILQTHFYADTVSMENNAGIAAIWVTNAEKCRLAAYAAMRAAGVSICEEWIWVKTTTTGETVSPLGGLWRKPYEVLVIGRRRREESPDDGNGGEGDVVRRVIAAVPDVHSRKPNLREIFERIFFNTSVDADGRPTYSALEVFARNLTAGWHSCGDEVLKFNSEEWYFPSEAMP